MKTIQLLIYILISGLFFGQNKAFFYEYRSIPDSTQRENIRTEMMVLNVNKKKSEFYSLDKYVSDSTLDADSKKGIMSMPPNKTLNSDRVIKTMDSKSITFSTILSFTKYFVSQDMNLKWTLLSEFNKILGYDVQKATTNYGGRKWTAWFTKEIPIQDGPYKFSNLPGLTLKIEDTGKNHVFELKGIKNTSTDFIYPELNNFRIVKLSYPQFVKVYKKYRKNPMADQVDSFVDYTDAAGVTHTATESFRNNEKIALEELSKDNNIIEIELINK